MATDELSLDLGDHGGRHRLRSFDEAIRWVEAEISAWTWIPNEGGDRFGVWSTVSERLNWLSQQLSAARAHGQPLANQHPVFEGVFRTDTSGSVLHSESLGGRRVLDIRESDGAHAATSAYAILTRRVTFNQLADSREVKGGLLALVPAALEADASKRRLDQERRNLRDRADRLLQQLEDEAAARRSENIEEVERGRRLVARYVRNSFRRWRRRFDAGEEAARREVVEYARQRADTAEAFGQLQKAFLEAMHLQAPATYWKDKGERHRTAETAGVKRLLWFFPAAIILLGTTFWFVGAYLLNHPPAKNVTPLFVVASAGLATLAGVTFWIGRLLTKLYLSEHHLRIDADERAIMTTTYLALTKDGAASEAERQIILGALFRSTPDGIVKDDGSVDVSLASLLSKVGLPAR